MPRRLLDIKFNDHGAITENTLLENTLKKDALIPSTTSGRPLPTPSDLSFGKPSTSQMPKRLEQPGKGGPRNSRSHSYTPHAAPPPGLPADTSFPMYYLLRSTTTKHLTEQRTVLLSNALENALGVEDPPVTLMRNGSLLVQATTRNQSSILSSLTSLGDTPIITTPDEIRNTSKGTIYSTLQKTEDIDLILNILQQKRFNVTNVYRFPPRQDSPNTPNPRLLLTFNTPFIPTKVKIAFESYNVRPYIPRPRRCFKCQRFGHPRKYCRGERYICVVCGRRGSSHPLRKLSTMQKFQRTSHCLLSKMPILSV